MAIPRSTHCKDCNVVLDNSNKKYNMYGAQYSRCQSCFNKRAREQRQEREIKNPELKKSRIYSLREWELKHKYGLTKLEYDMKFVKQLGGCAICRLPCSTGKELAVDHNHETGEVRDLLCSRCNLLLSFIENREDLVIDAVEYLKRHAKKIAS